MAGQYMDAAEVAASIHPTVPVSTVHHARRTGALASTKVGRPPSPRLRRLALDLPQDEAPAAGPRAWDLGTRRDT